MAVNMVTAFLQFGVLHFDGECECKCPKCGKKLGIYKTKANFPLNEGWLIYTEARLICMDCKLKSREWDWNAPGPSPEETFKSAAEEMQPFDGKEVFGERWNSGLSRINIKQIIQNTPNYADECCFIVYYYHNGERWFYGATSDRERAEWYAENIGGYIYDQNAGEGLVKLNILNAPEYAANYRYIVYRREEGKEVKHWFYGAYNEFERALKAAEQIRGFVYDSKATKP